MSTFKDDNTEPASPSQEKESKAGVTRREFLMESTLAAAALALHTSPLKAEAATDPPAAPAKRPNILMFISDEFRGDFICAAGKNSMDYSPNLDSIYERGTVFQNAITNQPLCSPARACLFTGQYATTTGVWHLGPGLHPDAVTLATELHQAGYTTNYIGKWHLAPNNARTGQGLGDVPPEYRGGFADLWQASNVLELTSHPYHGTIWNGDGTPMEYKDITSTMLTISSILLLLLNPGP